MARMESKGETNNDIKEILSGQYKQSVKYNISNSGTLSYRFAWVYERIEYLTHRPIGENLFGLGLITDSQTREVYQRYKFNLGLTNPETGIPYQMSTPDIAYGNLVTQFGFLGGILLLYIWFIMTIISYKYREFHPLVFCLFITLTSYILSSVSGSIISDTGNLVIPFLILAFLMKLRCSSKKY